jgi:hypothetical protein
LRSTYKRPTPSVRQVRRDDRLVKRLVRSVAVVVLEVGYKCCMIPVVPRGGRP